MNRTDLLRNAWISVNKILPPNDPTGKKQILIWLPGKRTSLTTNQNQARMDAERFTKEIKDDIPFVDWSWDRLFSHWMPITPPERK